MKFVGKSLNLYGVKVVCKCYAKRLHLSRASNYGSCAYSLKNGEAVITNDISELVCVPCLESGCKCGGHDLIDIEFVEVTFKGLKRRTSTN